MVDLQLPRPLLIPSAWPKARDGWLSIAHVSMGGPIDRLWSRPRLSVVVPENFWATVVGREPSLGILAESRFENIEAEVEIVSRAELKSEEQSAWRRIVETEQIEFKVEHGLEHPTLLDWSRELFPETFRDAGEIVWRRELQDYETQIDIAFVSMDAFRFWPGFLKSKKLEIATSAAREWATAQVLFSPQDDRQSEGTVTLLNPTLQTLEDTRGLTAIWRVDQTLKSRAISWSEAAAIDELRETPRTELAKLKNALETKSYPFKEKPNFTNVLAKLSTEGLILRR